jgi:cold shock CspA family protein
MEYGKVKWFSQEKGYGFITSNVGEDHYFNVQGINGANLPSNGDGVSFESNDGNKGKRALNITITSKCENITRNIDDRVNCPSCNKKIVPRMITHKGNPEKSVCPYCAATVSTFSKCFIATAVYGDPCCNEVRVLRKFRDEKLLTNKLGSMFVQVYYKLSPTIANWLLGKERLSKKIRALLNYLVKHIKRRGL